jgi:mersacidin/lichenicidin family type 2 lantibiotic
MSHLDIIRAWKDEEYRSSLSDAERILLPDHPAGLIELTKAELDKVTGGAKPVFFTSTWSQDCAQGTEICKPPPKYE